MRLINTTTFELREFFGNVPPYAILSHTWGTGEGSEVTLGQWMNRRSIPIQSQGLSKILKSCEIAAADGLEYVWVDTCCIDKSSSAELSEAINSMFMWYQRAKICYAYLEDLTSYTGPYDLQVKTLRRCRWFSRGWTLQELIAPKVVRFYDTTWQWIGYKSDLARQLADITNISYQVFINNTSLSSFSVAQRMSWAAHRTTTRKEDLAYCLLGLFNVNMPLLYGEEDRAFVRLQEHIMQKTNDLSILAWGPTEPSPNLETGAVQGCLALSPADFACSGHISRADQLGMMEPELVVTNKGIRIDTIRDMEYTRLAIDGNSRRGCYILRINCFIKVQPDFSFEIAIPLQKWGPNVFVRDMQETNRFNPFEYEYNPGCEEVQTIYLLTSLPDYVEGNQGQTLLASYRRAAYCIAALRVETTNLVDVELACTKRWPSSLWDAERSIFFVPVGGPYRQWTACRYVVRSRQSDEDTWLSFYVVLIWCTEQGIRRRPSKRRNKQGRGYGGFVERQTSPEPEGPFSSYTIIRGATYDSLPATDDTDKVSDLLDTLGKNQRDSTLLKTSLLRLGAVEWDTSMPLKDGECSCYQVVDCNMRIGDGSEICTGPMWQAEVNFLKVTQSLTKSHNG